MYKCDRCLREFEEKQAYCGHKGHCGKNRNYSSNAWNRGLTKYTDARVREFAKMRSRVMLENPTFKGKHHTEEAKKRISKSRILYLELHPDEVPYLMNHSSKKSYPEKIFEKALNDTGIKGWQYHYRNGLYQYDFAFPELKIDVEIDGGTHKEEKVIKIDERRDAFSKSQGWTVIRFEAQEVKKNVSGCIQKLKERL